MGEPAANSRALIAGSYSVKDEKAARELMKRLDGTFELKEKNKKVEQEILKAKVNTFFKGDTK